MEISHVTMTLEGPILNPKRPGLFGLLNTRGGAESAHFGKRSLTPPNFILEQQTESHMKADIFF